MDNRSRIGIDIGLAVFIVGTTFQAGVQYKNMQVVTSNQLIDRAAIESADIRSTVIDQRLTRLEQMVSDIKSSMDENKANNK